MGTVTNFAGVANFVPVPFLPRPEPEDEVIAEPIFEVTQESDSGYCAECLTLDIFTQGENWDDLRFDVRACFFDGPMPERVRLHLAACSELLDGGLHALRQVAGFSARDMSHGDIPSNRIVPSWSPGRLRTNLANQADDFAAGY